MTARGPILDKRRVSAGTVVIKQGTTGTNAYVIESGRVEVFIEDETGKKTVVAELGPEAVFGEMSAVTGSLRSASVRAVEDCVLINIPPEDMQEYLRSSTGLYSRLMRMVTDRMWDNNLKMMGQKPSGIVDPGTSVTLRDLALHVAEPESKGGASFLGRIVRKLAGE